MDTDLHQVPGNLLVDLVDRPVTVQLWWRRDDAYLVEQGGQVVVPIILEDVPEWRTQGGSHLGLGLA